MFRVKLRVLFVKDGQKKVKKTQTDDDGFIKLFCEVAGLDNFLQVKFWQ
jgi:hypothetical protein